MCFLDTPWQHRTWWWELEGCLETGAGGSLMTASALEMTSLCTSSLFYMGTGKSSQRGLGGYWNNVHILCEILRPRSPSEPWKANRFNPLTGIQTLNLRHPEGDKQFGFVTTEDLRMQDPLQCHHFVFVRFGTDLKATDEQCSLLAIFIPACCLKKGCENAKALAILLF